MLIDLALASFAALLACVAPGWFWAVSLRAMGPDLVERLTFSTALSLALVPPVALVIMWISGTGVTALVAVLAPLIVLIGGLAVRLYFGPAKTPEDQPKIPPIPSIGLSALLALVPALGLLLWMTVVAPDTQWPELFGIPISTLIVAALLVLAGALSWRDSRPTVPPSHSDRAESMVGRFLFQAALVVVLSAILARGYLGPVLYDWPYLRGGDQYNHGVQANEMLAVGHFDGFLVYPPGFSTITAIISRLSGLEPLEIFPVLAPALILLPAVACYSLAKDLWGRWAGLAAVTFSGLLLNGVYENIADARYPNLVSAQFLLILVVAALIRLYRSPEPRPALVLALLGSSVVLYHSVGTFYTVLLLAPVATLFVPLCLILEHRRRGIALFLSMTLLGFLSVVYAWDTYDLGKLLGGLLTGTETGAGGEAVSIVVGTQPAFPLAGLLERVSPAVFPFALLGLLLLFVPGTTTRNLPAWLSRITLLLWCGILFAGSRTALSAFPQRFERDLGVPLSVLAALALVAVLSSLSVHTSERRLPARAGVTVITAAAAVLALSLIGTQAWA
ncbi:MAG: hypothetical protein WA982_17595, partial [Rubrobacteraceae bacterium]